MSVALGAIVPFSMPMTGQICFSLTRVLVSKKRHDEVVDAYKQAVNTVVVGDPWKAETQMGPLSMKRQLDRVMGYLDRGRQEGAKLVTGGGRPKDLNRGYFVEPTIFSNVTSDMTIAEEEILDRSCLSCLMKTKKTPFALLTTAAMAFAERSLPRIPKKAWHGQAHPHRQRDRQRIEPANQRAIGGYKESGIGRVGGSERFEGYRRSKRSICRPEVKRGTYEIAP